MVVVDASCLYAALTGGRGAEAARRRMEDDTDFSAPHVIDAEVLGTIRRDHHLGRLDGTAAAQAVTDLRDWPADRFGQQLLLERAWDLRDNVRTWDAPYVALAEVLEAPLITFDGRLARATGVRCTIELIGD